MPSDDRDPKFERALAQHLRGGSAQASCPDAETLAAYHERNLSLEEMSQWKQHISACEACQEALALVETTENQLAEDWEEREIPVLEAASIQGAHAPNIPMRSARASASTAPPLAATPVDIRRRRRPALLRWAIPLGAAAAGVLVWIGIHEQRVLHAPQSKSVEVAQNREAPAAQDQKLSAPETKVQPSVERDSRQAETVPQARRRDPGSADHEGRQSNPAAPTSAKDASNAKKESMSKFAYGGQAAAPPIPPAKTATDSSEDKLAAENRPAVVPPSPTASAVGSTAGAGVVGGRAASNAAPAPAAPHAMTQTIVVTGSAPTVETSTASTAKTAKEKAKVEQQQAANLDTNAMMMKQGAVSESVEVKGADIGLILTPDNKVFWKLQPAGTLQLTTDGGKDWKSLETGANEYLTTGFAPSSRVCWIAGRSGTLLLTKDRGSHWTKINTPITDDLGGVHAFDAKHASIWDATNHISYATSDGGATWKQTANE
jgi:Photosynthesis system II assembly factor YCF48